MAEATLTRPNMASMTIVESTPQLRITLPNTDAATSGSTILISGMTPPIASAMDWVDLARELKGLYDRLSGGKGDGGGTGGKKCESVLYTAADGKTVEVKTCTPAPQ